MRLRSLRGLSMVACLSSTLVLGAACTSSDQQASEPAAATGSDSIERTTDDTASPATVAPIATTTPVVGGTEASSATDQSEPATTPAPARRVEAPPAAVGGNWISIGDMSSQAIEVLWSDVADSPDLAEILDLDTVVYRLHRAPWFDGGDRDQIPLGPDNLVYEGADLTYMDTDLDPAAEYTYFIVVEDGMGQTTAPRWRDGAAVDDTTPPTTVTGFVARRDGADVVLSWDESTDDYRFATYQIYRSVDGSPMEYYGTGWGANQTSFIDDNVPVGAKLRYEIEAVDFHLNSSLRTGIDVTS